MTGDVLEYGMPHIYIYTYPIWLKALKPVGDNWGPMTSETAME